MPGKQRSIPGSAITTAIKAKQSKYLVHCQDSGMKLEVYAMEVYGRLSRDLQDLVHWCSLEDPGSDQVWQFDPRLSRPTPSSSAIVLEFY